MEPVPIPNETVPLHYRRHNFETPTGGGGPYVLETVAPANLPPTSPDFRHGILIQCSDSDLEKLQENGGLIWLELYGRFLPQFSIDVLEDRGV